MIIYSWQAKNVVPKFIILRSSMDMEMIHTGSELRKVVKGGDYMREVLDAFRNVLVIMVQVVTLVKMMKKEKNAVKSRRS